MEFFRETHAERLPWTQSLDSGADFPSHSEEQKHAFQLSVAQCLLQLLDSLPEPIVPFSAQSGCLKAASRDEAFEVGS